MAKREGEAVQFAKGYAVNIKPQEDVVPPPGATLVQIADIIRTKYPMKTETEGQFMMVQPVGTVGYKTSGEGLTLVVICLGPDGEELGSASLVFVPK